MTRRGITLQRICLLLACLPGSKVHVICFSTIPSFHTSARSKTPRLCPCQARHVSATSTPSTADTSNSTTSDRSLTNDDDLNSTNATPKPTMPWSDFQAWALRDNLPHYLITIPTKQPNGEMQDQEYALWRLLGREVTELSGYSIEFLQDMLKQQQQHQHQHLGTNATTLSLTPKVLPLLDDFEFAAAGGLSGRVYGVPGLADGSKVETSALQHVEMTVPRGYVQTTDGSVAYELGQPRRQDSDAYGYSLSGSRLAELAKGVVAGRTYDDVTTEQEDPDTMLVRLGVSSVALLAGATAINMLSHHLTVNVFWV